MKCNCGDPRRNLKPLPSSSRTSTSKSDMNAEEEEEVEEEVEEEENTCPKQREDCSGVQLQENKHQNTQEVTYETRQNNVHIFSIFFLNCIILIIIILHLNFNKVPNRQEYKTRKRSEISTYLNVSE